MSLPNGLQSANISTLTPLFPFTNLALAVGPIPVTAFILAIINLDPTNSIIVNFEVSEDGIHPDAARSYNYEVAPGMQQSLSISGPDADTYFAITAQSMSPSFPTVAVKWAVRAKLVAGSY